MWTTIKRSFFMLGTLAKATCLAATLGVIEMVSSSRGRRLLAVLTLTGLTVGFVLARPIRSIPPGTAGVRVNRLTGGMAILDEGWAIALPGIASQLAWATARRGDLLGAGKQAEEAFAMLARVAKEELADDDAPSYAAAAVGVAASRWAALPALAVSGLSLKLADGEAGETCVTLVPKNGASSEPKCTHGQVWSTSLRASADRRAAVIAVEPLPGWLELWMFRRGDDGGWMVDVLAPNTDGPDRGYVELAGFSPDGAHALVVRESRTGGVVRRSFETITIGTLAVDREASNLGGLGVARRWGSADWRQRTVALR